MKRAYVKIPVWWLDDREIATLSDSEWRKFVESYARDPKNIHYEIDVPEIRRKFTAIKRRILPKLLEKYNHKCNYCGSRKNLEVDHIIALANGGNNSESNLQILCRTCNRKKGAK